MGTALFYDATINLEANQLKEPLFTGSCTAMITPFTESGIDYERLKTLLDYQAENGSSAVVIAGTTGEISTLEDHEYEALVVFSVEQCAGRMKVIAGIGGNFTELCCRRASIAEQAGADGIMMTAPYYNKTSREGLVNHFLRAADSASLPLILYNVPSRTAIGIPLDVYLELSRHPNINGVKEASGDFSLIAALSAECPDSLNLWSGNDDHTIPMTALGAKGVISVASNLLPGVVARLCRNCLQGDFAAARELHQKYGALFRVLFIETNPIPVKAAMAACGMDSGILRAPLVSISDKNRALLYTKMAELPEFEELRCIQAVKNA